MKLFVITRLGDGRQFLMSDNEDGTGSVATRPADSTTWSAPASVQIIERPAQ